MSVVVGDEEMQFDDEAKVKLTQKLPLPTFYCQIGSKIPRTGGRRAEPDYIIRGHGEAGGKSGYSDIVLGQHQIRTSIEISKPRQGGNTSVVMERYLSKSRSPNMQPEALSSKRKVG